MKTGSVEGKMVSDPFSAQDNQIWYSTPIDKISSRSQAAGIDHSHECWCAAERMQEKDFCSVG